MREKRQLTEILTTIADHAERATLVQDRSVRIIKQVCRGIAGDARTALALAEADRNSFAAMREALQQAREIVDSAYLNDCDAEDAAGSAVCLEARNKIDAALALVSETEQPTTENRSNEDERRNI